jgi:uncharacterized repeat protein (TIGR03987 family)
MIIFAIVFISLALVCYTIGVWSEKFAGGLKWQHLIYFWLGFLFDTLGTTLMSIISGSIKLNIHSITGLIAIILMFMHAIWASIVLVKHEERMIRNFRKLSIHVWVLWLIPYFTGFIINIRK